ncbi:hypothetical protein KEM54_002150 [Ascosphaera aggregata]|nr:hypothetical protein KEM54_002150 [Ascosphaera aggregata]
MDISFLRDHDDVEEYRPKDYPTEPHECSCKPACEKYAVGNYLEFFTETHRAQREPNSIKLRIEGINDRWTNSVGLTVHILDGADVHMQWKSSLAYLKLFDRRFSFKSRRASGVTRWSQELEHEFYHHVAEMTDAKKRLPNILSWAKKRGSLRKWEMYDVEHAFALKVASSYGDELHAYDTLSKFQGEVVPKVFSQGYIDISPNDAKKFGRFWADKKIYTVPGILMEYIPGECLTRFEDAAPNEAWPVLFEKVTDVVKKVEERFLIRQALHPKNFLFLHTGEDYGPDDYRLFMIDLRRCKTMRDYTSKTWVEDRRKQHKILTFWRKRVQQYQLEKRATNTEGEPEIASVN